MPKNLPSVSFQPKSKSLILYHPGERLKLKGKLREASKRAKEVIDRGHLVNVFLKQKREKPIPTLTQVNEFEINEGRKRVMLDNKTTIWVNNPKDIDIYQDLELYNISFKHSSRHNR